MYPYNLSSLQKYRRLSGGTAGAKTAKNVTFCQKSGPNTGFKTSKCLSRLRRWLEAEASFPKITNFKVLDCENTSGPNKISKKFIFVPKWGPIKWIMQIAIFKTNSELELMFEGIVKSKTTFPRPSLYIEAIGFIRSQCTLIISVLCRNTDACQEGQQVPKQPKM